MDAMSRSAKRERLSAFSPTRQSEPNPQCNHWLETGSGSLIKQRIKVIADAELPAPFWFG